MNSIFSKKFRQDIEGGKFKQNDSRELGNEIRQKKCQQHHHRPKDIICQKENKNFCVQCIKRDHKDHINECVYFEEYIKSLNSANDLIIKNQTQINSALSQSKDQFLQTVQTMGDVINDLFTFTLKEFENSENQIDEGGSNGNSSGPGISRQSIFISNKIKQQKKTGQRELLGDLINGKMAENFNRDVQSLVSDQQNFWASEIRRQYEQQRRMRNIQYEIVVDEGFFDLKDTLSRLNPDQIETINFNGNKLISEEQALELIIEIGNECSSLQTLVLNFDQMGEKFLSDLNRKTVIANIREISFQNFQKFTNGHFHKIVEEMGNTTCLEKIDFSNTNLDDIMGIQLLSCKKFGDQIQRLYLNDCPGISQVGIDANITQFAFSNLVQLQIQRSNVTNKNLHELKISQYSETLIFLSLAGCKLITQEGWREFFSNLCFFHIQQLDISDNDLDLSCLQLLGTSSLVFKLKDLGLSNIQTPQKADWQKFITCSRFNSLLSLNVSQNPQFSLEYFLKSSFSKQLSRLIISNDMPIPSDFERDKSELIIINQNN